MLFSQGSSRPFCAAPCSDVTIDTLQLLTEQIVAQVHTLVNMSPEGLKNYDLLQSLYTAFGQGLAVIGGFINAAAPINRIPPELMATIFALSPSMLSPPSGYGSQLSYWPFKKPCVDDLHKLPKVCRHWREVALTTPTLWSNIVTLPYPPGRASEYYFRRSVYLPEDLSVGLNVHLTTHLRPSKRSLENIAEFMVKNAPRIRELHAWSVSSIDLPSFLQSFDANSLEHCTISILQTGARERSPELGSLFSNGGPRLRSLCLNRLRVLPKNEFPALTLLKIMVVKRADGDVYQTVDSFVKFLAGSPNLEEVYIDYISYSRHTSSPKRSAPPTTISLPHLRHLAFTYYLHPGHYDNNVSNPTDLFLEQVCIPPTCHMYLATPIFGDSPASPNSSVDIMASVCRHVPGKDAVSCIFFQLPGGPSSPMQLVFPQGSLRLDIPASSSTMSTFPHHELFGAFPHLFSSARELRIHYINDPAMAVLDSPLVSATFPNVATLSVIRDAHRARQMVGHQRANGTLHAGLAHLTTGTGTIPPPLASICTSVPRVESAQGEHRDLRYPLLDTLWTTVESSDEIGELGTTLTACAALGLPIRRLVVTLRYSPVAAEQHEGLDDFARLRALDVEKVVVMDGEISSELREVDWLTRLPERHDLPSSIHRDWPTVWGTV